MKPDDITVHKAALMEGPILLQKLATITEIGHWHACFVLHTEQQHEYGAPRLHLHVDRVAPRVVCDNERHKAAVWAPL